MADFSGKDRRGLALVFPQFRWDHAVERGHFAAVKGTWQTVMAAFVNATVVLDNPPQEPTGIAPPRVAGERYVSFVPEWNEYLIVPVVVAQEPFSRAGAATLPPPVRIAWSAYSAPKIPTDGTVLWKWPPDDPES